MSGRDAWWALAFVLASASLQAIQTVPFDGDTAYHVAVARLIAEHGILHQFPWTPFSSLADHYGDKDLVFHLVLVPLSHLSYPLAAKLVGTLLGALLLGVFYGILRAERVESPGLWTVAMLVSSGAFLMRFALVRPHLLSIPLMMGVAWLAIREKRRALGLLCFVYPLCYIAWHAVLIVVLLVEASRFLAQRTISVRNLGIAGGAMALGVLVHPNFPAITEVFWIANVEVLGKAWGNEPGFSLGRELAAMSPSSVLRFLAFPLLVVGVALWPAIRRRAEDLSGFAFLVGAIAFLVLTFRTERFVEYSIPFSFLAGATSLRSLRKPGPARPDRGDVGGHRARREREAQGLPAPQGPVPERPHRDRPQHHPGRGAGVHVRVGADRGDDDRASRAQVPRRPRPRLLLDEGCRPLSDVGRHRASTSGGRREGSSRPGSRPVSSCAKAGPSISISSTGSSRAPV